MTDRSTMQGVDEANQRAYGSVQSGAAKITPCHASGQELLASISSSTTTVAPLSTRETLADVSLRGCCPSETIPSVPDTSVPSKHSTEEAESDTTAGADGLPVL